MTPAFSPSCHTPAKLAATRSAGAAQAWPHRADSAVPADPAAIARRKSRRVVTVRMVALLHRQPFCGGRARRLRTVLSRDPRARQATIAEVRPACNARASRLFSPWMTAPAPAPMTATTDDDLFALDHRF